MDGNVTLQKLNYSKCSMFLKHTVFNTTFFFHQLFTHFSYFASQTN
jgi:hypothetical protein